MPFPRASGILLHPTSFPSRYGIGDLGGEAYRFIDFLEASYQKLWQVLPLCPTGYGNSPYMSDAALAGNPLLISPDQLKEEGLLTDEDLAACPEFNPDFIDFEPVIEFKISLLKKACATFKDQAASEQQQAFETFCQEKSNWLDNYALFMALKQTHEGKAWFEWEPALAKRQPDAIAQATTDLSDLIFYYKYIQFEFFRQWSALKAYANERQIEIIGDIPIYVAPDSADVWANPENFCLDPETGKPALMAGVPPDYFSATGQLWGNPVYDWEHLQKTNFQWWVKRFQVMLDYVDLIRIDHFRGFEAFWAVPQGEETALNGEWVKALGDELFEVIRDKLGKLPVLAEDLGMITPEVESLRDKYEFPGMKVLHFAFGSDPGNPFLPFNYPRNCIVYTGTHDNNTTAGWFANLPDWERQKLIDYLGCVSPDGIHWDLIRLALSSVADLAIVPLQDVLGLGENARMNFPGKSEGNWAWRYRHEALVDSYFSDRLRYLSELFGRKPQPSQP